MCSVQFLQNYSSFKYGLVNVLIQTTISFLYNCQYLIAKIPNSHFNHVMFSIQFNSCGISVYFKCYKKNQYETKEHVAYITNLILSR